MGKCEKPAQKSEKDSPFGLAFSLAELSDPFALPR